MQTNYVEIVFLFSFHPYLFFNEARDSFSFFGFTIVQDIDNPNILNLIIPETEHILIQNVMPKELFDALQCNMKKDFMTLETNPHYLLE